MSSTEPIDEKKNEGADTSTANIKGFVLTYMYSLIFTIGLGVFVLGATGLYTSKVAQANILTSDSALAPFTTIDRVVEETPIDINIMRQYFGASEKDTLKQRAIFDSKSFLQSYSNSLVCKLKNLSYPNSSMFANGPLYWSTIYNNMTAYNNWAINTIFFYLSYLPESIIMILYSAFAIILWILLYMFNICLSIIFHITAIPQLVRNATRENPNEWQAQSDISFINLKTICLFLWIIPAILSFIIIPLITTINGIIAPLCATYRYEGGTDKQNILNFIINTFVYKKFMFMILASLSLISNGISYLGTSSILIILIAIIILYFLGFYSNTMPNEGENGFVSGFRKPFTQLKADVIYTTNSKGNKVANEIIICPPPSKIPTDKTIKKSSTTVTHDVTNALEELRANEDLATVNITTPTNKPSVVATDVHNTLIPNTVPEPQQSPLPPTPLPPTRLPINDMDVSDKNAPSDQNQNIIATQKGGKKPRIKKYNIKLI